MSIRTRLQPGTVFGLWTVLCDEGVDKHHKSLVRVRCVCGVEDIKEAASLRSGLSAGCRPCATQRLVTHGHTIDRVQSSEYMIWRGIKKRCHNPKTPLYSYYGGRGISMYPEWRASFDAFFRDVGPRPSKTHSIDRWPNNDGNYEPGNVRWATKLEQMQNMRSVRFRTLDDEKISLSAIARYLALPRDVLVSKFRAAGIDW